MVFSSITFLFYFLPLTGLIYFIAPKPAKNLILFIASLLFYAWGEPVYVLLMLFSIWLNYIIGLMMKDSPEEFKPKCINLIAKRIYISRKMLLGFAIISDIAILFFFKYISFAISTLNSILPFNIPMINIALPIGISFYTFQIISYIIDLYRGNVKVQKSFIHFGTYISLFPQLIAGPIVRYIDIETQLEERTVTLDKLSKGISRFVCGLCKKIILANGTGAVFDILTSQATSHLTVFGAWIGIVAFTLQIYFDFSGYSDMAIGLGKMFGFDFCENFNYPYTSKSVTEFWRRWHISLGSWFKEYVYFPLGGSRVGKYRTFFNLFAVWFLTGLWHGASYNFIVWGLFYCVLLIIEKTFLMKILKKLPDIVSHIYLMLCVMIGWVFFSMNNLTDAIRYIGIMFGYNASGLSSTSDMFIFTSEIILFAIAAIACTNTGKNAYNKFVGERHPILSNLMVTVGFLISLAYLVSSSYNPFLYFRF